MDLRSTRDRLYYSQAMGRNQAVECASPLEKPRYASRSPVAAKRSARARAPRNRIGLPTSP